MFSLETRKEIRDQLSFLEMVPLSYYDFRPPVALWQANGVRWFFPFG